MEKAKHLQMTPVLQRLAVRAVWACAALVLLAGCSRSSPEQALRVQLQQMQAAVEARESSRFMDAVADDFAGNEGIDRAALHKLLRLHFLANPTVNAGTSALEIEMHGDRATVRFNVLLAGGSGRFLPERVQTYQITSGWRLEGDDWRVYHAQW